MPFRDIAVSGDLPLNRANWPNGWNDLRTYNIARWHEGGNYAITLDYKTWYAGSNTSKIGVRLALYNFATGEQPGATLVWNPHETGQRWSGSIPRGWYGLHGRAVWGNDEHVSELWHGGIDWAGTLHLRT